MKINCIAIHLYVAHGRGMPGVVRGHTALLKRAPDILETVKFKRAYNRGKKFPRIVIGEGETVAFTGARIIFLYSIGQATHGTHNRHTTIAHGDQLTKTARLKA